MIMDNEELIMDNDPFPTTSRRLSADTPSPKSKVEAVLDSTATTSTSSVSAITLILFVISLAAALMMRLPVLAQMPLSVAESAEAWAVWRFWQAGSDGLLLPISSPAYFTLTAVVSQLSGHNDAIARLVPALIGTAAALLPWLLHKRLGTIGAFVAAMLMAASPLHAAIARTAGGDAIALFSLLLLLTAVIQLHDTHHPRWQTIAAIALGLGFASSPLFYGGLFTLLLATAVQRWAEGGRWVLVDWKKIGLIAAATFFLSSTLFLWYPAGIGAAAQLPATWLGSFALTAGLEQFFHPFFILVRYETIALVLMVGALLWALRDERPFSLFLVYWMAATLFLLLVQQGNRDNAVLLTLPGFLLIGLKTEQLLAPRLVRGSWIAALAFGTFGAVLFVNLARYARMGTLDSDQFLAIWIGLLLLLLGLLLLYFWQDWQLTAVFQGALIAILAVTLFLQWGTAWELSHLSANDPRERWVDVGTSESVRTMAAVMRDLSDEFAKSESGITIASAVESPLLRWYLRDFTQLDTGNTIPPETTARLLITGVENGRFAENYVGADFDLTHPSPIVRPQMNIAAALRWVLFHDYPEPMPEAEKVILWWRIE